VRALERSQRSEVALVERQEAPGVEPAREHDNGEVGQPDVKVGELPLEPRHDGVVVQLKAGYGEPARGEVGERTRSQDR
jgi:hypothetical protein